MVSGCNDQFCIEAPRPIHGGPRRRSIEHLEDSFDDCAWKDEFLCLRKAECTRQSDGKCGFTQTPELNQCLQKKLPRAFIN
eukprot:Awhi_evm1s5380